MPKKQMITGLVDDQLKEDFQKAVAQFSELGGESAFVRSCAEALLHIAGQHGARPALPLRVLTVAQRDALVRAGVSVD